MKYAVRSKEGEDMNRAVTVLPCMIVLAALGFSGCYSTREPSDGRTDPLDELEAEPADEELPAQVTCEGPAMSVEELAERFDELLGTTVCVEGVLDSVGCVCVEDWPCTPPACGYICSGRPGFKVEGDYDLYMVESGWECECYIGGSCITCAPLPCREPTRVIVVPRIYLDVMRRLEVVEVCFPPLPEP